MNEHSSDRPVVVGMFLYEGFRDYWQDRWNEGDEACERIDAHVGGAIEQAQMLGELAPVVAAETQRWLWLRRPVDRPGVLAYEVWNPLGWQLAERAARGETPSRDEVREALFALLAAFFGVSA